MKNITITLFACLAFYISSAQQHTESSNHLPFKGVPIDSTLGHYVSKMKQKGFKHIKTENNLSMLQGEFAGYSNCYLGISRLTQKDIVYKIVVLFPEQTTWPTLSGNYFNLKEMLTEKYGSPTDSLEKFNIYTQPKDDAAKLTEVGLDHCKYYAVWETAKGTIQLSIDHNGSQSYFVRMAYFDKINGEAVKKQVLDDL